MPSKIISKVVTSFGNEAACLGVGPKSCKITKNSSSGIPTDTSSIYLSDQDNPDVGSCEGDEYVRLLASNSMLFQKPVSAIGFQEPFEETEFPPDLRTMKNPSVDCNHFYKLKSTPDNAGNATYVEMPHPEPGVSYNRSSSSTDFRYNFQLDGQCGFEDRSGFNVYSNSVAEQETVDQRDVGAMIFSLGEGMMDTLGLSYEDLCDEVFMDPEDSWLQQDPQVDVNNREHESDYCFPVYWNTSPLDADFFNDLPSLLDLESRPPVPLPPRETDFEKQITLVLDLDETLVHTTPCPCDSTDFSFEVEGRILYVQKRPFLHTFLEKVGQMFQIIIFTAGTRNYADQVLDSLDPGRKLTSRRAYRDSCIFSDKSYTKDLRVLGVDLARLAIVDNTPAVFHELQLNNGIPIKSWLGDPGDRELLSLLPFLEILAVADDVRPIIAEQFGCS